MSRRKRFDRLKKEKLRRFLAERDRLVPEGAFERFPDPYVRCSECKSLVPFSEITIGHIRPLSEGGTHHPTNLRLECDPCNQEQNNHAQYSTAVNGENATRDTAGERRRLVEVGRQRAKHREARLYDSVVVLDVRGRHASYTSFKQARYMLETGKMNLLESHPSGNPKVIQLQIEIPLLNPDEILRENRCVICDATRYLATFSFWPRWHPEWTGARKTHRTAPLCRHCVVQAQRWLERVVEEYGGREPHEFRDLEVGREIRLLLHAHGRMKKGLPLPERLLREIQETTGLDLAERIAAQGTETTAVQLSKRVRDLKQAEKDRRQAWRSAYRKRILGAQVDFHEFFWDFVRRRREELAPFLKTDGSLIPRLEAHLRRVRFEMQARGVWGGNRRRRKPVERSGWPADAAQG